MSEPTPPELAPQIAACTPEPAAPGMGLGVVAVPVGRWSRVRAHPAFAIFITIFAIWVGWNVAWLVEALWAALAELDREETVPFSILTLASQGTAVAVVWLASGRLPHERKEALALRRSPLPQGQLVYVAFASIGLHNLWCYIQDWLGAMGGDAGEVPTAQALHDVSAATAGLAPWLVLIATTVLVAACEEICFRGYLMRRLQSRWSVATGVGVSAFVFATAHLHPTHVVSVLPVGVWLGYLAWKTNSTMTSIVGHAAVLLFIDAEHILARALGSDARRDSTELVALWGLSILFGVWSTIRVVKTLEAGPRDQPWTPKQGA